MNLLDMLFRPDTRRMHRRLQDGSPVFTHDCGIIAANGAEYLHLQTDIPATRRYEPLDWLEVVNNSTEDLQVDLNGNENFQVPAATIRTIRDTAIWSVTINNLDAVNATAAGEIVLTMQRTPASWDKVLRGVD